MEKVDFLLTLRVGFDRISVRKTKKGGETEMASLQERMVEYRAKERISQSELGTRCGLSKQTINSIENGTQEPTKITKAKIELVVGKEEV